MFITQSTLHHITTHHTTPTACASEKGHRRILVKHQHIESGATVCVEEHVECQNGKGDHSTPFGCVFLLHFTSFCFILLHFAPFCSILLHFAKLYRHLASFRSILLSISLLISASSCFAPVLVFILLIRSASLCSTLLHSSPLKSSFSSSYVLFCFIRRYIFPLPHFFTPATYHISTLPHNHITTISHFLTFSLGEVRECCKSQQEELRAGLDEEIVG
jgi:hypothetical protein